MENWNHSPPVLTKKVLFTLLLGIGCVSIAAAIFFHSRDSTLLVLGILIFSGCVFRSISLLWTIGKDGYDTVIGTCTNIETVPFRRYQKIYLLDEAGNEITLLLGKYQAVKPGASYRFYFQRNGPTPSGNDYLDAMLSANSFLGCEEWFPEKPEE